MICTILSHELKDIEDINNLRLWIIRKILDRELKALDVMKSSGLWIKMNDYGS